MYLGKMNQDYLADRIPPATSVDVIASNYNPIGSLYRPGDPHDISDTFYLGIRDSLGNLVHDHGTKPQNSILGPKDYGIAQNSGLYPSEAREMYQQFTNPASTIDVSKIDRTRAYLMGKIN